MSSNKVHTETRFRRRGGNPSSFDSIAFAAVVIAVSLGTCSAQSPGLLDRKSADPQGSEFAQFLAAFSQDVDASKGSAASDADASANDSQEGPVEILPVPAATAPDEQMLDSSGMLESSSGMESDLLSSEKLTLADVIASTYRAFPEIAIARQQPAIANGQSVGAWGAYDTKFEAFSLSEPTGFYRNYRNGLGLARQTWWGGYAAAGYRIGRGFYQPWYKERQTDDAGEFKVKMVQPLLQGRAIDAERVAVFRASLARQMAAPAIQQSILDASREAADAYWKWVSIGGVVLAQKELLQLAVTRASQFEAGVKAGKFPEVDLILNQQLIAERRAKLLQTEQKFRDAAFKLSLYLRDEVGQRLIPDATWVPMRFPEIQDVTLDDLQQAVLDSLSRRPEPQLLLLEIRQIQLDQQLARNQMLPRLDFVAEASQDMGEPSTKSDDKGDFELVIGITSDVPIQRRKARGKIQETAGKINQLNEKLRYTQDKIAVELQTARNALAVSADIAEQARNGFRASLDVLQRYRVAFNEGKIDLIYLNLLESKVNETEIKLVEAQRDYFAALAQMQVALGLDPLDQAMMVSELPLSTVPSPATIRLSEDTGEDVEKEEVADDPAPQ